VFKLIIIFFTSHYSSNAAKVVVKHQPINQHSYIFF